ncbi:ROK family protein [Microbacterium oleivorans]|uniref:ROK family protein n=1 Tax=Microbacterium oleivorans TaxID=273677 RepID=A0A7D5IUS9_9MICO|nr:ROK family protein [Microbacterium oleivorans]
MLAIDVGGTDIKSAVAAASGAVGAVDRRPTPRGPAALLDAIDGIAAAQAGRFQAVGLVVPGIVEGDVAVFSENLGWSDVPLGRLVRERLGVPVAFGQDVRAAATAEMFVGGGARFRDPVVMVAGTGLSAVIVRGHRVVGGSPLVGEIGHAPIAGEGSDEPCVCGLVGCLEAVASAASIARRYRRLSGRPAAGARDVLDAAARGDAEAARVWDAAVDALAFGLSHLVATLAPDAVLIAGGLSRAGDTLIEPVRERLAARLSFHKMPVIEAARLGAEAGVLGAALDARALYADSSAARMAVAP